MSGLDLYTDRDLVLNAREARYIALLLGAVARFEGDAGEIIRPIGILNRRVVQIHRLQTGNQALDFAFRDQIHDTRISFGAQAVGCLLRHPGSTATTLATTTGADDERCHAATSSTSIPALITADPTISRP